MKIKWRNKKYIGLTLVSALLFSQGAMGTKTDNGNKKDQLNSPVKKVEQGAQKSEGDTLLNKSKTDVIIPVMYGTKKQSEVTGAVSTLKGSKVENIAGTNRINSLTGLLPGLIVQQDNGMPGSESTKVFVRGNSTFGISGRQALVIVDGIETEISLVSPYDIESVTVLKDAVATAIYGMRGSNGIILITTKRGRTGDIRVNLNAQTSIVKPSSFPKFYNAAQYATLYNEALINEGGSAFYTPDDIAAFASGESPYTHPNNDYIGEFFKEQTIQQRYNLDISGGNETAQYYFNVGYVNNNGIYNVDEDVNTYDTNTSLNLTDMHANLNFNMNKRLTFNVDLKSKFDRKGSPGGWDGNHAGNFLNKIFNTPPGAYPLLNEDGSLGGSNEYKNNLYGLLNNSGYSIWNRMYLLGNFDMKWDMSSLVEGLSMRARMSFSNTTDHSINRSKDFAVYQPQDVFDELTGEYVETVMNKIGQDTEMNSSSSMTRNDRLYNTEFGFNYIKSIGKSNVNALLMVDRQEFTPFSTQLSRIYQAVKGSVGYNYDNRYLVDATFSYQGSEQYVKGKRYGMFPALGAGWVVSNEAFLKESNTVTYLKLRASYGITGNDFNPYGSGTPYFAYLENYQEGNGYPFGVEPSGFQGFYEANASNDEITWEKASKLNIGLNVGLLKDQLSITADYFKEENKEILIQNANPQIFGAEFLFPVGIAKNSGFEGEITWKQEMGDFSYFLSANGLMAKSNIVEQAEEYRAYDWMKRTGNPIGSQFGYVFDRYFTEADDLASLPDQSQLGLYQAGDLKYKDLNNDGFINENDQRLIGKADLPELFYGVNLGIAYKAFDFKVLFQGALLSP